MTEPSTSGLEPRAATSRGGTPLTVYDGIAFDKGGRGPYALSAGCPNCGKGKGEWWDPLSFFGAKNAGNDPDGPCSRVCRLQWEYAGKLAARDGAA